MAELSTKEVRNARADGLATYYVIACAGTWLLAMPAALAWMRHQAPSPLAIACAGFSAMAPLVAAFVVAKPRKRLREVFGRYRAAPHWVALALVAPPALHLAGRLLYTALGGHVDEWLRPPMRGEELAALFVLPLGEEFGWRGFAHAPMARRFGQVRGALLVGLAWGFWHLAYSITPEAAEFDLTLFAMTMVELPLYSLVIAWLFERTERSMLVALAFHAGGHLDHIERTARDALALHVAHVAVVALAATFAARSLSRRRDDFANALA